jgi:Zn-dependent oligopeptidase
MERSLSRLAKTLSEKNEVTACEDLKKLDPQKRQEFLRVISEQRAQLERIENQHAADTLLKLASLLERIKTTFVQFDIVQPVWQRVSFTKIEQRDEPEIRALGDIMLQNLTIYLNLGETLLEKPPK